MLVVSSDMWPSQARIVLMSTPAWSRWVAVEWRMTCGLIRLPRSCGAVARSLPAQRTHPFGHRILEELTFLILPYLFVAGLPKVDDRLASQMLRFDFGIVQELCHFLFSSPRETPLL